MTEVTSVLAHNKIKFIKRLFCYHKWTTIGNPYLWDGGMTKRADVRCVKCNKLYNVDIFATPKRRWHTEK
jgi:hypothetical protein